MYISQRIATAMLILAGSVAVLPAQGIRRGWRTTAVDRAQLGPADAIEIVANGRDIFVTGTDDNRLSYAFVHVPDAASHTRASWSVVDLSPGSIVMDSVRDGRLQGHFVFRYNVSGDTGEAVTFGAGGMRVRAGQPTPQANGVTAGREEVHLEVPRAMKSLKVTLRGGGAIHVEHFEGELSIESDGGPVELLGISGPALVAARNGTIRATIDHLPAAGNGALDLQGSNGDIVVTLPADARFTFDLQTYGAGHISSDFPLDASTAPSAAHFQSDPSVTPAAGDHLPINASDLQALSRLAPGVVFTAAKDSVGRSPLTRTGQVNGGGITIKIVAMNGSVVVTRADRR